ncbi:MAG: lipase maturation factor family protein, partial [Deltaproteobacteria bacterium]|nr:lipase maturation factor family protein [Deltaproteobacteria bacterium]
HLLCGIGLVCSLAALLGFARPVAFFLLWLLYLSLSVNGQVFLTFQWDILLLEAGFLAIFFGPSSSIVLWLLRWLLFRLMLQSGLAKLASGDPAWRDLTALTYHYETQPLTTWSAWWMHQLPRWFHQASAALMFAAELGAPFLIFARQRFRTIGCAILVALQLLIIATGNYCFFNCLAIVLCVPLLTDATLRRILPARLLARFPARPARRRPTPWKIGGLLALAATILVVSGLQTASLFTPRMTLPQPVATLLSWLEPLRVINRYGLFAVMTKKRLEIIVEGSHDGIAWLPYEFAYKPGDPARRPGFVIPHQPRLDWQMWFASLGTCERTPWFGRFTDRLLAGSPAVLGLLKTNPFPDAPPRYVRSMLYEYRFADPATRRSDSVWWRRTLLGPYCPPRTLPPHPADPVPSP